MKKLTIILLLTLTTGCNKEFMNTLIHGPKPIDTRRYYSKRTNHITNIPIFSDRKIEGYHCRMSNPRSGTYKCWKLAK